MTSHPIFITTDIEKYLLDYEARLLNLKCSEEYAAAAVKDRRERILQVEHVYSGNAILSGRAS